MFGKKENNEIPADLELFLIYDSKVNAYEKPSFAMNEHDMIRQVLNLFTEPGQERNKYFVNAEDYSIFSISKLWLKSGKTLSYQPHHIANMHELKTIALRDKERVSNQVGIQAT